jgi:hypothetical protein
MTIVEKKYETLIKSLIKSGGRVLGKPTDPDQDGVKEILLDAPFKWVMDGLIDGIIEIPSYQRKDCWKIPHRIRYTKDVYQHALENKFMSKPNITISIRKGVGTVNLGDGGHNVRSMLIYTHKFVDSIIEERTKIEDYKYSKADIIPFNQLQKNQQTKILSTPIYVRVLINSTRELEGLEYDRENSGSKASEWDKSWAYSTAWQVEVDKILKHNPCFCHPVFGYDKDRNVSGIIAIMMAIMGKDGIKTNQIKDAKKYLTRYETEKPESALIKNLYDFFNFCEGIYNFGGIKTFSKANVTNTLYPMWKETLNYEPRSNVHRIGNMWFNTEYTKFFKSAGALKAISNSQEGSGKGINVPLFREEFVKVFRKYLKTFIVSNKSKRTIDTTGENPQIYKK